MAPSSGLGSPGLLLVWQGYSICYLHIRCSTTLSTVLRAVEGAGLGTHSLTGWLDVTLTNYPCNDSFQLKVTFQDTSLYLWGRGCQSQWSGFSPSCPAWAHPVLLPETLGPWTQLQGTMRVLTWTVPSAEPACPEWVTFPLWTTPCLQSPAPWTCLDSAWLQLPLPEGSFFGLWGMFSIAAHPLSVILKEGTEATVGTLSPC